VADRGTAPAQQSLQLILARNLISTLSTPAFLVDPDATVVFYNDAAGDLLGLHYEETGKVALDDWRLPLKEELCGRRPVHTTAGVTTAGDVECEVEVLALPLIGPDEEHEGAVGVFWPREGAPR
jgi:PAS domain-containing protein